MEVAKVKITFINPNIVTQKGDFFGTGIPYMPIVLAYAASFLREKGFDISVVDALVSGQHRKESVEIILYKGCSQWKSLGG